MTGRCRNCTTKPSPPAIAPPSPTAKRSSAAGSPSSPSPAKARTRRRKSPPDWMGKRNCLFRNDMPENCSPAGRGQFRRADSPPPWSRRGTDSTGWSWSWPRESWCATSRRSAGARRTIRRWWSATKRETSPSACSPAISAAPTASPPPSRGSPADSRSSPPPATGGS
ncbi:hypothetical protein SDC9_180813 [bioreactor metagenome]|uniref:Uncharacterized protein n=1 Tax=bioreactor metagenome TaxID=1076179 RepID=A0A645H2S7_9ZZZZ